MNKAYYIIGVVVVSLSIPLALGSFGDEAQKIKSHRDMTIKSIRAMSVEACQWQVKYVQELNSVTTDPSKMRQYADYIEKAQDDCSGWIQEQVFPKSETTKN